MSKRTQSTAQKIKGYKKEEFDPTSVYLDKETNLLKAPSSWTRSGCRIINEEEKKIYFASLQKRNDQQSPKNNKQNPCIAEEPKKSDKEKKIYALNSNYVPMPQILKNNQASKGLQKKVATNEKKIAFHNNLPSTRINSYMNNYQMQTTSQMTFIKQKLEGKKADLKIQQQKEKRACPQGHTGQAKPNIEADVRDQLVESRKREPQEGKTNEICDRPYLQNKDQKSQGQIQQHKKSKQAQERIAEGQQQPAQTENINVVSINEVIELKKKLKLAALFTSPILREDDYSEFIKQAIDSAQQRKLLKADLLYLKGKHCQSLVKEFGGQSFPFLIIFRSQNNHVFGIYCTGLSSSDQNAVLFNATSKKVFHKIYNCQPSSRAAYLENNYLVFGNSEITIKNGNLSQIQVNCGNMHGKTYFNIPSRYDFTGEQQQKVLLAHLQLHRIQLY